MAYKATDRRRDIYEILDRVLETGQAIEVERARAIKWTRDPFDRLIVAQAAVNDESLLTRDKIIRANDARAIW